MINSNSGLRNPDKDMTLYGKYAKKITIHFDFGEGSVKYDSYKTSELAEGETTWLMTGNNSYAYEREGYFLYDSYGEPINVQEGHSVGMRCRRIRSAPRLPLTAGLQRTESG